MRGSEGDVESGGMEPRYGRIQEVLGREGDAGRMAATSPCRRREAAGNSGESSETWKCRPVGLNSEDWPRSELGGGRVSTGVRKTVGWAEELCYGGLGPAWLSRQPCAGVPRRRVVGLDRAGDRGSRVLVITAQREAGAGLGFQLCCLAALWPQARY